MQRKTNFLLLLIFITGAVVAQPYSTAVGLRLGANTAHISPGFTAKHFLKEDQAVEVLVGINNGIGICGLYQWHKDIETVPNLHWFAGGGGYAAFWKTDLDPEVSKYFLYQRKPIAADNFPVRGLSGTAGPDDYRIFLQSVSFAGVVLVKLIKNLPFWMTKQTKSCIYFLGVLFLADLL